MVVGGQLAGRILRMQIGIGAAAGLIGLAIWGRMGLISALVGAATCVIGNAYRTYKSLQPARTARQALGQLYLGELVNFVLTIALFLAAAAIFSFVLRARLGNRLHNSLQDEADGADSVIVSRDGIIN